MDKKDIQKYWKEETDKEIPEGWNATEKQCFDFIIQDSYYSGYNEARARIIKKAYNFLHGKINPTLFSTFQKYMEE